MPPFLFQRKRIDNIKIIKPKKRNEQDAARIIFKPLCTMYANN